MKIDCLVDFDNTLLKADSMAYIVRKERLFFNPVIFFWGVIFWFATNFLPNHLQFYVRRKFKFAVLKAIKRRGEKQILDAHSLGMSLRLDHALIDKLNNEYERIFVVSSSWKPVVESVLLRAGIKNFVVYATEYNENFSDFRNCWFTNKIKILNDLKIEHFDLFTDSLDDEPLVSRANRVIWTKNGLPISRPTQDHYLVRWILVLAFAVRVAALKFGLPFWTVGDEPAMIFGALKMMELKTLFPSLHASQFVSTFYYGPYLPYLYLAPFALSIAIRSLFFPGSFTQLVTYLTVDTAQFFVIARLISIVFGLLTVWLVYRSVRNITQKEQPALWAAFFLSVSLMHTAFSTWARHWGPAGFGLALVIYFLSHPSWELKKRYTLAAFSIAFGVGISVQAGLSAFLVILWAVIIDKVSVPTIIKQSWFWKTLVGSSALIVLAYFIWPYAFGFISNDGPKKVVSLSGLIYSYAFHFFNLLATEPLLLLFVGLGLVSCFVQWRRHFVVFFSFILLYIAIFYKTVSTNGRFILMLYPLLAILAGIGFFWLYDWLYRRSKKMAFIVAGLVLSALLIIIFRYDFLVIKNDTRVQAKNWLAENISPGAKIAIAVPLMGVETTASNIEEQRKIEPKSIRTLETAEEAIPEKFFAQRFNALNLYSVESQDFYNNIKNYLSANHFDYFIYNPDFIRSKGAANPDFPGKQIWEYPGTFGGTRWLANEKLPDGFGDGLKDLFMSPSLGPDIFIVKLR